MAVYNQLGHQSLPVSLDPVGLTMPLVSGSTTQRHRPRRALIQVLDQPIRWRADGTDPTSTTGHRIQAESYIDWTGGEEDTDVFGLLMQVKFVRDAAATGDAQLEISFFS